MAKNTNRDDFSEDTKRTASERVGLRCSFCNCLTKAAPQGGNAGVVNIGVAAHIYAAAPGGPRYNENMTKKERSSIDNCIWLCETHAKLIDSDVQAYPSEMLIERKRLAEQRASEALKSGESCYTILQNGGFGLKQTKDLLDETIKNGDYRKLQQLLYSMKPVDKGDKFQDLYDYFEIVYSFYCDRINIRYLIQKYIEKGNGAYIDQLTCLFSQFFEKNLLAMVYSYCKDANLKAMAEYIVNDRLNEILQRATIDDLEKTTITSRKQVTIDNNIRKIFTMYALNHYVPEVWFNDGTAMKYYDEDYYYKQRILLLNLHRQIHNTLLVKKQNLDMYDEYIQLIDNFDNIKLLTLELQVCFWRELLEMSNVLGDSNIYDKLYVECSQQLQSDISIKDMEISHRLDTNFDSVNFMDITKICCTKNDYLLAHKYFSYAMEHSPAQGVRTMEGHKYLFTIDSMFLDDYIQLKQATKSKNFSPVRLLESYKEHHAENFVFHTLMAFYSMKNSKYKKNCKKECNWLLDHFSNYQDIPAYILRKLICVFGKNKNYKELLKLDELKPPMYFRLQIADWLMQSKEYIPSASAIYLQIVEEDPNVLLAYRGLFISCYQLGDIANAKKYLLENIKLDPTKENYCNLLSIRIETHDIKFDELFDKAKTFLDAQILYLVGETYLQSQNSELAREYFLKSLLLDDKNLPCYNAFISAVENDEKRPDPETAQAGVMVTLKNEKRVNHIAIHKDSFLSGFEANHLAKMQHYKETDKHIEDILYHKVGDTVVYNGKNYIIDSLMHLDGAIFGYSLKTLLDSNKAETVQGDTPEESVQKLVEILKARQKHVEDIIEKYKKANGVFPITTLSSIIGKKIIETYEFLLYGNKIKLRNLNSFLQSNKTDEFILSIDSIFLLAALEIDIDVLNNLNCKIGLVSKHILLSEIAELSENIKTTSNRKSVVLHDDQVYGIEASDEQQRAELKFLNRLKRITEGLTEAEVEYSYGYDDALKQVFIENKLFLEGDVIGFAAASGATLVSDDTFLSTSISIHNIPAIGMNKFLTLLNLDYERYLQCIQNLAIFNFGNYITQDVYMHIKSIILNEKDNEAQIEKASQFYDFLTGKFLKNNPLLKDYHDKIVQEIARTNFVNNQASDGVDRLVIRAISENFAQSHPEEYQQTMAKIIKNMRIRTVEEDGKVFIEWYQDERKEDE